MRGDLDVIGELLDPEVKWDGGDPSAEGACGNREDALAFMRRVSSRNPTGELVDVIYAGERVVVVIRPAHRAELRANVTTFRDGKVIEMVALPTPKDALAAAGVSSRLSPPYRMALKRPWLVREGTCPRQPAVARDAAVRWVR